jgi:DNA-binding response OmpR family regulator
MSPEFTIKRILVVDDDPVQLKLLEGRLKQNGYDVSVTQDAAVGLQTAINSHPDCVILDVMMPVINGYNFCHLLKSQPMHKNIAIILVTSRDKLEDVDIGLKMGADAYLMKPVNIDELLKTIKVVEGFISKKAS